jgi:hypothetical protein
MAGFLDNIQPIVEDVINAKPQAKLGIVKQFYGNTATVQTSDGTLENIKCVSVPVIGSNCVLVPVGEEYVCIPFLMEDGGSNIVTEWESTLSDTKVASEKLTKNTIDTYIGNINDYIGE